MAASRLLLAGLALSSGGEAINSGVWKSPKPRRANLMKNSQMALVQSVETLGLNLRETSVAELEQTMTLEEAHKLFAGMNNTKAKGVVGEILKEQEDDEAIDRKVIERAREMLNEMIEEAQMKKELEEVRCSEFDRKQLQVMKELEEDVEFVNAEAAAARAEVLKSQEIIQITQETKLPITRQQLSGHEMQCEMDAGALKQQLAILQVDIDAMRAIIASVCAVPSAAPPLNLLRISSVVTSSALANTSLDLDADEGSIVRCTSCLPKDQAIWLSHGRLSPMLASMKSPMTKKLLEKNLLDEFYASGDAEFRKVSLSQTEVASHFRARVEDVVEPLSEMPQTRPPTTPPPPPAGKCNEALAGKFGADYRGCQAKSRSGKICQAWDSQAPIQHPFTPAAHPGKGLADNNYCRNPDGKATIWCYITGGGGFGAKEWEYCDPKPLVKENEGLSSEKFHCAAAPSCKLSKPKCSKLRDRFLVILAAMFDAKTKLMDELAEVEGTCKEVKSSYEATISALESTMKEQQTALASATMSIQENQQQSELSSAQHLDLMTEYTKTMSECCANKNSFSEEICALTKIRGEVYKQNQIEVVIKDCEVAAWTDNECSVSCGGGKQSRTRSVIVATDLGTKCPPLLMERSCSLQTCPTDCKVDDWSEWSSCTAECGGGVQQRVRNRVVAPDNGGLPCPEQSESQACNVQACNANCVLGDWADWGLCSKACSTGRELGTRTPTEEARGVGTCAAPDSATRLRSRTCNEWNCAAMLPAGREFLQCKAKQDVIFMVDGSGSLGEYGWETFRNFTATLVGAMKYVPPAPASQGQGQTGLLQAEPAPELPVNVQVSVMVYSGPDNGPDFEACTSGGLPGQKLDVEAQCGIQWLSRLTGKVSDVEEKVQSAVWPKKTTLTSMALAEARGELINGRQDANSVVVVITDGKPMSPLKTSRMSEELKKQARLIWVPVGPGVDDTVEDMHQWASQPWQDNVLHIDNFATMALPKTVNSVISTICPLVK